jgi:hypothetical protein
MFKIIGGVIAGVFFGALMLEILRRRRPEVVASIETKAKDVSDKIFDNLRESYDFRDADA